MQYSAPEPGSRQVGENLQPSRPKFPPRLTWLIVRLAERRRMKMLVLDERVFPLEILLPPGLGEGASSRRPALQDQRANRMQISWDEVNRTEKPGLHFVSRLGLDVF